MPTTEKCLFAQAAVASGLVKPDVLDEVCQAVDVSLEQLKTSSKLEGRVAKELVKRGLLNRWQSEQLREGRTKFTLGPYRIVDSLGKGGMGHVFKGEHEMLGRVEAVKVLPKDRTSPETIESFQKEIRAQAQLDHLNLVRVSYAGQEGDTYFLVTELVPGTDLRRLVRKHGRLTMHEAATIITQAAQGLQHAHEERLVHRDVKPGNLLVTPEGRTKVTDLGLAWQVSEQSDDDTYAGKLVGTADYLAPELIRASGGPSAASDIYSLGCTLYYAITGKVPFPGGSTSDKLRRHLEEAPLNPRRFNPDLSDMFLDVLADMMEKDPVRRISTMDEVVNRLRPWSLSNVGIAGQTDGPGSGTGAAAMNDNLLGDATAEGSEVSFSDELEAISQVSETTGKLALAQDDTDKIGVVSRRKRRKSTPMFAPAVAALMVLAIVSLAALLFVLLWNR